MARNLGQAVLGHRFLIAGADIDESLVLHIVDDILLPYTAPRPADAG